jgi:hypothetical protein
VEAGDEGLAIDKDTKDTERLSEDNDPTDNERPSTDEGPEAPDSRSHPYSRLEELPLDIFVLITPHLPVVTKACLALSCKAFYGLLRSALDDKSLSWPRFLASPSPCREASFGSAPYLPRNQLLLKLEDDRWLYCFSCLKLHPHGHFPRGASRIPPAERSCIKLPFGGIVDVCACLALTHSHGARLAEWVETGRPGDGLHQKVQREFELKVLKDNRRVLVHECSVTCQPDVVVALTATVTLNANSHLVVKTRYGVSWSKPCKDLEHDRVFYFRPYQAPRNTAPIALCPHTKAFFWSYGRYYPYQPSLPCRDTCGVCDTKIRLLGITDDGLYSVIQSERDLGLVQNDRSEDFWEWDNYERWHRASRFPGNDLEN